MEWVNFPMRRFAFREAYQYLVGVGAEHCHETILFYDACVPYGWKRCGAKVFS